MPATAVSLQAEQRYRLALIARSQITVAQVRAAFARVDAENLGDSFIALLPQVIAAIRTGQEDAQLLAHNFLQALSLLETGQRHPLALRNPNIPGTTSDGRDIRTGIVAFIPAVFIGIRRGLPVQQAINLGRFGAVRFAHTEVGDAAWRETQHQAQFDSDMEGWTWVTGGSKPCGACLAQQNGRVRPWSQSMGRHAGCTCVQSPVYASAPERVKRPTGMDIFNDMTPTQQAATFKSAGEVKAALLREGRISMDDLVKVETHPEWRDSITEAALVDLGIDATELTKILASSSNTT